MTLPTPLAKRLLMDHFRARMEDPSEAGMAVGDYQRMSLVGTEAEALSVVLSYFKPEHRKISGADELSALRLVHDTVKQDVLGMAVEALVNVASAHNGSSKDKILAATILGDMYGDKEVMQHTTLTDKLVVDLVGKG